MPANQIIEVSQVPKSKGIFFLGCFEKRVTLYAQQVRALNLVDAILSGNLIRKDGAGRVAIVGAGVAGITAAAAFAVAADELTIDIYEQQSQILHLQIGSNVYLHPHLYDWPSPHALQRDAGLPLLNWQAGKAGEVIKSIERQYLDVKSRSSRINEKFGCRVCEVKDLTHGGEVVIEGAPSGGGCYDVVLLSIGFGYENYTELSRSYWSTSDLDGPIRRRGEHKIVISGNGDGGLVEFQKAVFNGIGHDGIVELLTGADGMERTREMLLEIEDRFRTHGGDLYKQYLTHLTAILPKHLMMDVHDNLRRNTRIWFHRRRGALFRPDTAILNRFGTFVALEAHRSQGEERIYLCRGRKADLHSLDIELEGEPAFKPTLRYLRFGANSEENLRPFQTLVGRYPKATRGVLSVTPELTRSARDRFRTSVARAITPFTDRSFEERHATLAIALSKESVPRKAAVNELLEVALTTAGNSDGRCGLVMLVGASGSGKSVLMAQAYAMVRDRALYFSMDSPPNRAPEPRLSFALQEEDHAVEQEGEGKPRRMLGLSAATAPLKDLSARQSTLISGISVESNAATSMRVHWLAETCALVGKNQSALRSPPEAVAQITAILCSLANRESPVHVFIDGVNQADNPEELLSGLELDRLPAGIVLIVSTRDDEAVKRRLRGGEEKVYNWKLVEMTSLTITETVDLVRHDGLKHLPLPEFDEALSTLLHNKVANLPLMAWGWGQRLQQLMISAGSAAFETFRTELGKADRGSFPHQYVVHLIDQAKRDVSPAWLPEALCSCFVNVGIPMDRALLHGAQLVLRPMFSAPEDVSLEQVDAALMKLRGFLVFEGTGPARRWRLRNEVLREALKRIFGPEGNEGINHAPMRINGKGEN